MNSLVLKAGLEGFIMGVKYQYSTPIKAIIASISVAAGLMFYYYLFTWNVTGMAQAIAVSIGASLLQVFDVRGLKDLYKRAYARGWEIGSRY